MLVLGIDLKTGGSFDSELKDEIDTGVFLKKGTIVITKRVWWKPWQYKSNYITTEEIINKFFDNMVKKYGINEKT